jgi:hypothetical protein
VLQVISHACQDVGNLGDGLLAEAAVTGGLLR